MKLRRTSGKSKYKLPYHHPKEPGVTREYYTNPFKQLWHDFKSTLYGDHGIYAFRNKTLYNQEDFFYLGKVYIGTQLQPLEVIWDTGS